MTRCKRCQLKFAGSACPGCGAAPGLSTEKKVGFGVIVVVIVLAIVSAVSSSRRDGAPRSAQPSAAGSAPATP